MQRICLKEFMTHHVKSTTAASSLKQALDTMVAEDIHHLPVVDHQGKLVGIISDRDLLIDATKDHHGQIQAPELIIRDVMNSRVFTASPEDNLRTAVRIMLDHRVHSVPVVSRDGKLVGMVTSSDILRLIVDFEFQVHERSRILENFFGNARSWQPAAAEDYS